MPIDKHGEDLRGAVGYLEQYIDQRINQVHQHIDQVENNLQFQLNAIFKLLKDDKESE